MLLVFDLDDTLVDTFEAVCRSYTEAGATLPRNRSEWWGRASSEWLSDRDVHERKKQIYPRYMHLTRELPLADVLRTSGGIILTGASFTSAQTVLKHWGLDKSATHVYGGLTRDGKMEQLSRIAPNALSGGVYFDNDELTCEAAGRELDSSWQVVTVR